jgi:hypothetical protein
MTMEKPLFIPLCAEFFDAFACGAKGTEFRLLGSRWNATTCRIGRAVTLSRGYGKSRRLSGIVAGFAEVGPNADPAIRRVYPFGDSLAAIEIALAEEHRAVAFAWASGLIEFGLTVPKGALLIASGPVRTLRDKIGVAARHAYTPGELLVPGVPEAEDKGAALAAFIAWIDWRRDNWIASGLTLTKEGYAA